MPSIKQLEEELRRERNLLDAKIEQANFGMRSKQLRKNIKSIRRERKFGGAFAFARKVGRVAVRTGRGVGRAAVITGRGLERLDKQFGPPKKRMKTVMKKRKPIKMVKRKSRTKPIVIRIN